MLFAVEGAPFPLPALSALVELPGKRRPIQMDAKEELRVPFSNPLQKSELNRTVGAQ